MPILACTVNPYLRDNVINEYTLEASGFNFSVVGIVPANEQIDFFGKLGVFTWDASIDQASSGEISSDDGTDIIYGFGVTAKLSKQFNAIFEYKSFDLDGVDISNVSLGARLIL